MDRTTKILLGAIALGLFANAAATVIRPAAAQLSNDVILRNIGLDVAIISRDIEQIAHGECTNGKLC